MSINNTLTELYRKHWDTLHQKGKALTIPPANPLLLCVNEEEYEAADKKIMICGQETWGWSGWEQSIEATIEVYRKFFLNKEFYPGYGKSAFWKAFRYFENELTRAFSDQKLTFVWQNISKIGRNDKKTGVTPEIRQLERECFPVFSEEMRVLAPDIIIFLTGPHRDLDIFFHFPKAEFKSVNDRVRRWCRIYQKDLPDVTVRTYHPSYYRGFNNSLKEIILNEIVSAFNKTDR